MANFAASQTYSISGDGKTLTIIDTSNYDVNTQGYTRTDFTTRIFELRDAYGTLITTLAIVNDQGTYTLAADQWIESTLVLAGVAPYSNLIKMPLSRQTELAYVRLAKKGCHCCNDVEEFNALRASANFLKAANIDAVAGDGTGFQNKIDAAAELLTDVSC